MKIDYKSQNNLDQITIYDFLPFPQSITIAKAKVGEEKGIYITTGALHTTDPLHIERQALAMQLAAAIARDFDYRWLVYGQHPDSLC